MNMRHNKPYNVFGLILSLAYLLISPSLFADTYTYDASGRYSAIKHPNGQVFYYQYDRAGNILSIGTDVVAPAVFSSPVVVNVGSLSNIDITGGNPMGAHTYSATGLPAGLKIDPVTGLITGQITVATGNYTVSYFSQAGAQKSVVRQMTLAVQSFPAFSVGSFDALLVDLKNGDPAGRLEVTVGTNGAYTGKLTNIDGKQYSLRGTLVVVNPSQPTTALLNIVQGTSLPNLQLEFAIAPAGVLTAKLASGRVPIADCTDGVKRGVFTAASRAPWQGTYGILLSLPQFVTGAPEGLGYISAAIANTGVLTIVGKTADGVALTGTVPASTGGVYLPYLRPHATAGSYLAGVWQLQKIGTSTDYEANWDTGSWMVWIKAKNSADKSYPAGFGPVDLDPVMEKWTPPTPAQSVAARYGLGVGGTFGATIQGGGLDNMGSLAIIPQGSNAFAARLGIPEVGGTVTQSSTAATKETGEPDHDGNSGGKSLWWSWTTTKNCTVTVSTVGSNFDTVLAVYTGTTLSALTAVASDDDGGDGRTSLLTFSAMAGTTYQIAVDGYDGDSGNAKLTVTPVFTTAVGPVNFYGVPAWLSLDSKNVIGTAEPSPSIFKGSVNPSTGVFSGSFVIKDQKTVSGRITTVSRTVNVSGILLGTPQEDFGGGAFLLPPLEASDTMRSGLVIFSITPPRPKNQ
jgi:hypothetical protein